MKINSFIKVFAFPEFIQLINNKGKLLLVWFIVFVSLWAIGFSNSIKIHLKEKMDSPFVKFISIKINSNVNIENVTADLSEKSMMDKYDYSGFSFINTHIPNFLGINGKSPDALTRAVGSEDVFYNFLFHNPDVMLSESPIDLIKNDTKWGCIVTQQYLKKLGYDSSDVPYINYIKPGEVDRIISIPIAAVVKQLPDYLNMIVSEPMLMTMKGGLNENPMDSQFHNDYLSIFIKTSLPENEIKNKILGSNKNITFQKALANECQSSGYRLLFNSSNPDEDFNIITKRNSDLKLFRTYIFDQKVALPTPLDLGKPDYISIPFNSLDKVDSFQVYTEENHKLRIDMNVIEAKANFNFFDKISGFLIQIIVSLSAILLITLTLTTIFNHIEKNKANLGTLKAFGMSNWSITVVYTLIASVLIMILCSSCYFASMAFGEHISKFVLNNFLTIRIEEKVELFNLGLNFKLILFFLILPILIILIFIYKKLHNKTPGDLIYERD